MEKLTSDMWEEILLDILRRNNLVVTTKCNLNCVFCFRKHIGSKFKQCDVRFNDMKSQLELFKKNKLITVNSSTSRLSEGEAFNHPKIWDILYLMREKFSFHDIPKLSDTITITTNGTLLTDSALKKLEELKGIVIIHSINSTDVNDYMALSRASKKLAEISTTVPERIKNYKIAYVPSIVTLPNIVGLEGIEKTIRDINTQGVKGVRIFLPGYTKYVPEEEQRRLYCDKNVIRSLIDKLKNELNIKFLVYPVEFEGLKPKLEGYEYLGIKPSDEVLSIDGIKPLSRWHAQDLLIQKEKRIHILTLKEKNKIKRIRIFSRNIKTHSYLDLRLNFDMPNLVEATKNLIKPYKKILVVPSQTAESLVKEAFEKLKTFSFASDKEFYFQTAYNDFYGGNFTSAGLLTCRDYKKYIKKFIDENFKPDLILISSNAFDMLGRDSLKESIFDVMDELNVRIEIIFLDTSV